MPQPDDPPSSRGFASFAPADTPEMPDTFEPTVSVELEAEERLVLACARSVVFPSAPLPPADDVANIRWPYFVRRLIRHGLHCPAHRLVAASYAEVMPADALATLRGAVRQQAARSLVLTSALREIGGTMERAGIPYVVLKGLPLGQALYGDLVSRSCTDLDLLVAPDAFEAAGSVLGSLGFESAWELDPVRERACLRLAADMPLRRRADGVLIELHRRIDANPPAAGKRCARALLAGAAPVEVAGVAVPAVVGPPTLPYLAWHGGNHAWIRLTWLLDVALTMVRARPADLEEAWRAAKDIGSRRPLVLAWRLASDWLGVPVPEPARRAAAAPGITRLVERLTPAALGGGGRAPVGTAERRIAGLNWALALADGTVARAGILVRYPIAVQPDDARAVRLPSGLAWLYPVVRVGRLVVRTAATLPSSIRRDSAQFARS